MGQLLHVIHQKLICFCDRIIISPIRTTLLKLICYVSMFPSVDVAPDLFGQEPRNRGGRVVLTIGLWKIGQLRWRDIHHGQERRVGWKCFNNFSWASYDVGYPCNICPLWFSYFYNHDKKNLVVMATCVFTIFEAGKGIKKPGCLGSLSWS